MGRGSASFDVGETRTLNVAAGDRLLLQANAGRKQFINGELVEVKAVHGEDIVLTDGRIIPKDYRTFTYGYAVTSHAAQGQTANEVIVVTSSRPLPVVHRRRRLADDGLHRRQGPLARSRYTLQRPRRSGRGRAASLHSTTQIVPARFAVGRARRRTGATERDHVSATKFATELITGEHSDL